MNRVRKYAWIGLVGALWALTFSAISTTDYASHLDRGLHELHCSFIPGAEAKGGEAGCRVALNSPYAAVLKQAYWGGLPISLFGLGCFAFLVGHAAYLLIQGPRASRNTGLLYLLLAGSPLVVSLAMLAISWFKLGAVCKTCIGIYIGSALLAVSALGVFAATWPERRPLSGGSWLAAAATLAGILVWTLTPSVVYASLAPDHAAYVKKCGTLPVPKEKHGALLSLVGAQATRGAIFFEDPLCPTCKSLHERLKGARVLDKLSVELALFPLDSECNWMLDEPLHPGACKVSRAMLCAKDPAAMLDWAYENQERLITAGKAGGTALEQLITARWGSITACMAAADTTQRLNRHLHFAVDNAIAVSTPQVFLEGQRLCDEDVDIGLLYAMNQIAPGLVE
jgi:uncharacterized membrane protein